MVTATATKPTRELVNGGDPDKPFPIPLLFNAEDFREAPEIREIAEALMDAHDARFGQLRDVKIAYLWKRKGGISNGAAVFGKAVKPAPLVKYFGSQMEAIIWLAAEGTMGFTAYQLEALVFGLLSRLIWDDEKDTLVWVPPDFEGFAREFELYGDWNAGLKLARKAALQLGLFDDEDVDGEDD